MAYINPLSNISYTNRDFSTIYPELLDLVKKLTTKWDPSLSNESDPGVVLLKLNAIIADKCNYASDKNVLECFPLSVTQDANARQLYAQLGYNMHWYQSATTEVAMAWNSRETVNDSSYYCIIPKFTMVCDEESKVVYTLIGPYDSDNAVSDQRLPLDGTTIYWNALQGVAVQYNINGNTTITSDMLDANNRIYFSSSDIAENGIFITHSEGEQDYSLWKKVDNLYVEKSGVNNDTGEINYPYMFGVTPGDNSCYIEFPDNAPEIFRNGINITYLRTAADEGNISYNYITRFYSDLAAQTNYSDVNQMLLNQENMKILNITSGVGGKQKESIDKAYKNYQRTIGTFNTLITLRDYLNVCINSKYASNGYVTSRRNDIQSTYKISTVQNGSEILTTIVDPSSAVVVADQEDTYDLNAFNLKLYLLQYIDTISSVTDYNRTFMLLSESELEEVEGYIENQKAIEHDYAKILTPYTDTTAEVFKSHVCMFKNKYPLKVKITPKYKVTTVERDSMVENIKKALCTELTSSDVAFGTPIKLDMISSIIQSSDTRISNVYLDSLSYETYAVYWNGYGFVEVKLNNPDGDEEYFTYSTNPTLKIEVAEGFKTTVGNDCGWGIYRFECTSTVGTPSWSYNFYTGVGDTTETFTPVVGSISSYFTITEGGANLKQNDTVTIEINPIGFIRDEVFVKSILAGVTPLLESDNKVGVDINQKVIPQEMPDSSEEYIVDNVKYIKSSTTVTIPCDGTVLKLKSNESIQFFAPNVIDAEEYSNYVKFEYYISGGGLDVIPKNSSYMLGSSDYIVFYWKESTSADSIYEYHAYGEGHIICPSFDMTVGGEQSVSTVTSMLYDYMQDENLTEMASSYSYGLNQEQSDIIRQLTGNRYLLSGSKSIKLQHINEVTLGSDVKIYWVLNNPDNNRYVLFRDGQKDVDSSNNELDRTSYTLDAQEYFFYIDTDLGQLQILGAGTKVVRRGNFDEWSVPVVDRAAINALGSSALSDSWFIMDSFANVTVLEQQFVNLSEGCSVKSTNSSYEVSDTTIPIDIDEVIKYSTVKNPREQDYTILPSVVIGEDYTWECRSCLKLHCGPDLPQTIYAGQEVKYKIVSDESDFVTIEGVASDDPDYPVTIRMSFEVDSSGASGVIALDEVNEDTGETEYPSLYVYTAMQDDVGNTYKYRADGGCMLYFIASSTPASSVSVELSFKVPSGDYVLPLFNPYDNINTLTAQIKTDDSGSSYESVALLNHPDKTEFGANGTYYLDLSGIDQEKEYTLKFTCGTSLPATKVITLDKMFRYKISDEISQEKYSVYTSLIEDVYDKNNIFNYTKEINEDSIIRNPLDSSSFLNQYHIFNQFTICQLDTASLGSAIGIY